MSAVRFQRLRLCRYPLLLAVMVSAAMVLRVPVYEWMPRLVGQERLDATTPPEIPSQQSLATDSTISPVSRPATDAAGEATPSTEASPADPALPTVADASRRLAAALEPHAELVRSLYAPLAPLLEPEASQHTMGERAAAPTIERTGAVRNAPDSGGAIQFLLDRRPQRLAPGEELSLPPGWSGRIVFHRGGEFGNAEQHLTADGVYEFAPTPRGWVLSQVEQDDSAAGQ